MEHIEIPFGARDSENKGWEYTIPAGMEAVIEDGKVIVREKESEDERILRELMECFDHWEVIPDYKEKIKDWIERLIKQQGPITPEDKMNHPLYLEGFDVGKKVGETLKEQNNLGKYSDEENLAYRLNWVMQDYYKAGKDDEEKEHRFKCYQLFWDALEDANFFEQKEQQPVEWSEEDEESMQSVISTLWFALNTPHFPYNFEKVVKLEHWLKSLRPQAYLKPDVEDYKALNRAIEMADELGETNTCEILKGLRMELKFIHPFSWKPSEEQMDALEDAFRKDGNNEYRKNINSLYNDLQKLL